MARPKLREIHSDSVSFVSGPHAGLSYPIVDGRVTARPNHWAGKCWICLDRVAAQAGVVVVLDTCVGEVSGIAHALCRPSVEHRLSTLRERARAARAAGESPTAPAPAPAPAPAAAADDAPTADRLREALRDLIGPVSAPAPALDAAAVSGLVSDLLSPGGALHPLLADGRPVVTLQIGEAPPVRLPDSRHAAMEEAICVLTSPERLVWLVGPTGTGKTHMARMLAEALGVKYFEQACYGASESALIGFPTATGDYVCSPTVAAVDYTREDGSKGALLCLDELDGADESALLALNGLLAGDGVATPRRAGRGHTHRGSAPLYLVITSNTEGSGHGTREYNARTKLDDATRDRLVRFRVFVDYDEMLEQSYVDATGLPAAVADALHAIRAKCREHKLEGRHVSTRAFKQLGGLYATHPARWDAAALIEKELATWSDAERAKVGYPRQGA